MERIEDALRALLAITLVLIFGLPMWVLANLIDAIKGDK